MNPQHPQLHISVDEFTTPSPITAPPSAGIEELRKKMNEGGFRHLPIIDQGKVVGLVSQRDLNLLEGLGQLSQQVSAADFMRKEVLIVDSGSPIEEVAFRMSEMKVGSAIVCDESEEFVGIFTSTDALNALIEIIRGQYEEAEEELL